MSFRSFLEDLDGAGLLKKVDGPVSPVREVTDRAWGKGPILFSRVEGVHGVQNVQGSECCLNILSSRALLSRALGIEPSQMVRHLAGLDHVSDPGEQMAPGVGSQAPADWGPGDLQGLYRLGASRGCG